MSTPPSHADVILALARERGLVRARDAAAVHVPQVVLGRLVRDGRLERIARGVYALPGGALAGGSALGVVALRIPGSVVCLASALQVHELSTWITPEVWIAVNQHRRPPRLDWPPIHVVYTSAALLQAGVEQRMIDGVRVTLTTAARTVADCFKWRSTVGLDVAVEALRGYLAANPGGRDELRRMAELCRVGRVMRPYLEALQ
jgi:predicted transcriptional regulator of viral defense system